MKKIRRVIVRKSFLCIMGCRLGKNICRQLTPEGHFYQWDKYIPVRHKNHTEKDIRRFLRRIFKRDSRLREEAEFIRYGYFDVYSASFRDARQIIKMKSNHYNESLKKIMTLDKL